MKNYAPLKKRVVALRQSGKTYSEIILTVKQHINKSTLSSWCQGIIIDKKNQERIQNLIAANRQKARAQAVAVNKLKRQEYLTLIDKNNHCLIGALRKQNTAKIALAMLYLGEGSKTQPGSLTFGNSNPVIIELFLWLLRYCYAIDAKKFRCTVQCRADQNTALLEEYWSKITAVPLQQFYKARIDPRTIGKPSIKLDYKGVCRINYFSGHIFTELQRIANIIHSGL